MQIGSIKFEERYDNAEERTTTMYFVAPKELLKDILNKDYPDAVSMSIRIEMPTDKIEANYASVSVSPTRYTAEDDSYEDFDWSDVDLPDDEVEALIKLSYQQPDTE